MLTDGLFSGCFRADLLHPAGISRESVRCNILLMSSKSSSKLRSVSPRTLDPFITSESALCAASNRFSFIISPFESCKAQGFIRFTRSAG